MREFTNGVGLIPAGTLAGTEVLPMDGSGGGQAATVNDVATLVLTRVIQQQNWLIGGNFGQNLWQRGNVVTVVGPLTAYTADRWFLTVPTGSTGTVTQEGVLAQLEQTVGSGELVFGQVLTTENSQQIAGQTVVWSGILSAVAAGLEVFIGWGTGDNQSSESFAAKTWTGYQEQVLIVEKAGQFAVSVELPAGVTQVGVGLRWSDSTVMNLSQCQLLNGESTEFIARLQEEETALQLAYFWRLQEGNELLLPGFAPTENSERVSINFPVTMRVAPTFAIIAGGWQWNFAASVAAVNAPTLVFADQWIAVLGDTAIPGTSYAGTGGVFWQSPTPGIAMLQGTGSSGTLDFDAEL